MCFLFQSVGGGVIGLGFLVSVSLKVRVSFIIIRVEGEHRYLSCITLYKLAQSNRVLIHSIRKSRGLALLMRISNSSNSRRSRDGRDAGPSRMAAIAPVVEQS